MIHQAQACSNLHAYVFYPYCQQFFLKDQRWEKPNSLTAAEHSPGRSVNPFPCRGSVKEKIAAYHRITSVEQRSDADAPGKLKNRP